MNNENTVLKYMADRQEELLAEYSDYIKETAMTPYERKLLRRWVRDGHSVYEDPGSRYLCDSSEPRPFLDVYREDHEIKNATKGMTAEEKTAYLKEYTGYDDEPEAERALRESRDQTPEAAKMYIRKLQREIFHLWGFIFQEGLHDEAYAFVNEHADEEIPFEW